jgi:hypothetical protein
MVNTTKRIWSVPVRLIEFGRVVRVEAASAKEAHQAARAGDWLEASDPSRFIVSTSGAATPEDDKGGNQ